MNGRAKLPLHEFGPLAHPAQSLKIKGISMAFFVRLPSFPASSQMALNRTQEFPKYINIINGNSSIDQRELRRSGYAGIEPDTVATFLNLCCELVLEKGNIRIFDIGSNSGMYALAAKGLLSNNVTVAAFEPAPEANFWLQKIANVNNLDIEAHELALSDKPGQANFYLSTKSDASNSLESDFRDHKGVLTVEVETVDDFVKKQRKPPDLIKIDAETFDYQVLSGAESVISEVRPYIICEVLNTKSQDYGKKIDDLMRAIGDYHYYFIASSGRLEHREQISGDPNSLFRDWLFSPTKLSPQFLTRNQDWRTTVAECTPINNIAPPNPFLRTFEGLGLKRRLKKLIWPKRK
jgi:FkbM family methyltransferase